MKNLLLLVLIIASHIAVSDTPPPPPAVVIQDASTVKVLRGNMNLNNVLGILTGNVNPSVTATSANKGSLYLSTLTGLAYTKTDAGSTTNWVANSGDLTLANVGSSPSAQGASISAQVLTLQPADGTHPGVLTAANFNTFNGKQNALTLGNLTSPTTGVTIGSGTGAVIGTGTTIAIQTASTSQPGLLSAADWTTFNGKQSAITAGNISTSTTGVTVGNGTSSTIGPNVTVNIQTATTSLPGLLSAADWTTFNAKAPTAGPTFSGTTTLTGSLQLLSAAGSTTIFPINRGVATAGISLTGGTGTSDGANIQLYGNSNAGDPGYIIFGAQNSQAGSVVGTAWTLGANGGTSAHLFNGSGTFQSTGITQLIVKDTAVTASATPIMAFASASATMGQIGFATANAARMTFHSILTGGNFEWDSAGSNIMSLSSAGLLTLPGGLSSTNSTNSTSIGTGSIVTSGGIGVAKSIYSNGNIGAFDNGSTAFARLIPNTGSGGALSLYAGAGQEFSVSTNGISLFVQQPGAGVVIANFGSGTANFFPAGSGGATAQTILDANGISLNIAGGGVRIKTGSNARAGTCTLVAGVCTVTNNTITANTIIQLGGVTSGGTPGALFVNAVTVGTSFVVHSTNSLDTSTIGYTLTELL